MALRTCTYERVANQKKIRHLIGTADVFGDRNRCVVSTKGKGRKEMVCSGEHS